MASLLRILSLLAVVGASFAAAYIGPAEVHKDFPGKCYIASIGAVLPLGYSLQVRSVCETKTCIEQSGDLYLEEIGCGLVVQYENCRVVEDKSKPHPYCCPNLECN
uniref:Single VWC domain protein 2 n=1 Tax=Penaeus vannamei TaxID=6689 RepID=F5AW43_PENVA|nr:single VWC domain protein 2 [Penaeus vannamei]